MRTFVLRLTSSVKVEILVIQDGEAFHFTMVDNSATAEVVTKALNYAVSMGEIPATL